eukprot:12827907-Alexandrium_andersonii.AAC.1
MHAGLLGGVCSSTSGGCCCWLGRCEVSRLGSLVQFGVTPGHVAAWNTRDCERKVPWAAALVRLRALESRDSGGMHLRSAL